MPNILKKSLIHAPAVQKAPLTCDNTSGLYSLSIWSRPWSCIKIPSGKGGRLLAFFFKLIVAHNPHSLMSVCFLKIKQKDPLTSINIYHWLREELRNMSKFYEVSKVLNKRTDAHRRSRSRSVPRPLAWLWKEVQ